MTAAASPFACWPSRASWGTGVPIPAHRYASSKPPSPLSASPAPVETQVITSPLPVTRARSPSRPKPGNKRELYFGYETWSSPPQAKEPGVGKPKQAHDAASLAYLGDCVYELYARRHLLYPPLSIDMFSQRVRSMVRCESQDALLKKILEENFLTEEERDVLRWGRRIASRKTKTKRRAGGAVYSSASSLETLIGHLYLTDMKRLEELMLKLGLSANGSSDGRKGT